MHDMETIDLTLSSPEPEPRRRVIPRQSQLPVFFKKESGVTKSKYKVSQSASTPEIPHRQVRSSSSVHIAQLIHSSNPEVLKKVILELCQTSPALSGALERGLAIHSNTQNRIKLHDSTPGQPGKRDSRNFVQERKHATERKLEFTTPQPRLRHYEASRSQVAKAPSTAQQEALQKPHATQPVPRIKRELPVYLSGSDSGSDDDLRVPGSFPRSTQLVDSVRPGLRDQAGSVSTVNRAANPLSLRERLARLQQETLNESKRCGRCGDLFVRGDDVCLYHSGCKTVLSIGRMAWTCCNRNLDDVGCKSGNHMDQATYTGPQQSTYVKPDPEQSFKRPSASPDPSGFQQKKSRIF